MLARVDGMVARAPFFYGWVILAVGAVGLVLTSPGQTYAISIFIEHFIADFGLSRSLVSVLYGVGTALASLMLPTIGRRIDLFGSRRMMVIIAVLLALACVYMSVVRGFVMLLAGFLVLRLFGQGSLSLVSNNVINQWWVSRRGLAMGIAGLAMSLVGVGVFPNLIQWLIGQYGWRLSYVLLGALVVVVLLPLTLLFVRDTPEEMGLLPDGRREISVAADDSVQVIEENWTREEAIRTLPFWILSLAGMSVSMLSTGLFFHLVSIFADNGYPPEVAAAIFLPAAVSTAGVGFVGGVLTDRVAARLLMAVGLLAQSAALWLAPALATLPLAVLFGIFLGSAGGMTRAVNVVVWANYFGRRHLGSIAGVATTALVFGTALGPVPIGIARDLLGSYDLVLRGLAFLPLLLAAAALVWGQQPVKQLT